MDKKRILVVGCGLSGCVVARELAEAGFAVKVIDKRDHIGGNCYDYQDKHGIRIHRYGPHIFHTSNARVVDWLSQFTDWTNYEHKVQALLETGQFVPFPPNSETLKCVTEDELVETFYRPYSEKMWGMKLEEIDPAILSRVPIRDGNEDRYFPKDAFQKLPKYGYTTLVENILKHENIEVKLSCAFHKDMEHGYVHIFNSMPIDEYYEFCFGELPYRSIKFDLRYEPQRRMYPTSVVNFTDDGPCTRVTEWKNFESDGLARNKEITALTYEQPCDYRENNYERYYPVKDRDGANRVKYKKYADIPNDKVTFIGRCGMYVYIDMDQAVSSALAVTRDFMQSNGMNT